MIIGAGLAGLSCAAHLGHREAVVVEAASHVGGKARTEYRDHERGRFCFDVTGHWLHLRDPGIRAWILKLLGEDHFGIVERMSRIWSHGAYTRYPFQANTYGLPLEVVHECVMGAIRAAEARPAEVATEDEPESFADWIRFYFGEGIARHFMVPYNAKLWGVSADVITSRWCQRFVPKPNVDDIVAGALGLGEKRMGYNARFLYPKRGGIQSVAEAVADSVGRAHIHLETRVEAVDLGRREARLSDGTTVRFESIVNTTPLPIFVQLCADAPEAVRDAAASLRATEVIYLNVGVEGPLGQPDHWIYVPELEWPMYRVGSFSNAMATMAPEGCSSLYVEMSDRETPTEQLLPKVAEGLRAMGLVPDPERILFADVRRIPNAYVLYDADYHDGRAAVHGWLRPNGCWSIGRYGDWNYSSMEDALMDGRRAAAELEGRSEEGA